MKAAYITRYGNISDVQVDEQPKPFVSENAGTC